MEKVKKTFAQAAFAICDKSLNWFEKALTPICTILGVIVQIMLLLVFNPLVLWLIAAISKGGIKFAMSFAEPIEIIGVEGLYQSCFNKLPLSRKMMYPWKFKFSVKEQEKIAQKYGDLRLFELKEIAPEIVKQRLTADHLFRMEYIARWELTTEQADIIYDSGDKEAVCKLLAKRCPSAAQAEYLLTCETLNPLLPVYATYHVPGYAFLQKVKEQVPEEYPVMLEILNDKADAKIFASQQKGCDMLERRVEAAKRKLGLRGQRALLNCKEIDYVRLYLKHDAFDEELIMKLADVESTFVRELFKAFLEKYELSDEAKTVLRQGPNAFLIA